MKPINAITLSGFLLTAIAIYVLSYFPFLPAWPIFITWACFFHMDGGVNKNQAYIAVIRHIYLGTFISWMTALALFNNLMSGFISDQLWASVLIALGIALIMRLSLIVQLSVTPAIIYGYALIWAFLSVPGLYDQEILLSLTFKNAIVAVDFCVLLGASAGYINGVLVNFLCNMKPNVSN